MTETTSKEDRIVQSIYDHVLSSVCIGVASNMHELIKTGEIPMSELKEPHSRMEIFPDLYSGKSPAEIQQILDSYATEIPTTSQSRKRKLRLASEEADDGGQAGGTTNANGGSDDDEEEENANDEYKSNDGGDEQEEKTSGIKGAQTTSHLDIWGRVPPKEPKQTCKCRLCDRHVSTTRFASHLDKCMGISTRSPAMTGGTQRNGSSS